MDLGRSVLTFGECNRAGWFCATGIIPPEATRMPRYKNADLAQLAHQLTLSPRRQRSSQIAGAERLLEIVEPHRTYPYDFVCYHLTRYRPLKPSGRSILKGRSLIADLVRLIEHLTQSAGFLTSSLSEPFLSLEQLRKRFQVSAKTIARWRQRGLSGWRVLDEHQVRRLVFTEKSVQRFTSRHEQLVERARVFSQMTERERAQIVDQAKDLVTVHRLKLQEVSRRIAEETGRAVETIRYTLRRYDQQHRDSAIFNPSGRPSVPEHYHEIYRAWANGVPASELARRFKLSPARIGRIGREMKTYDLLARQISYVFHPEFDAPDVQRRLLEVVKPADSCVPMERIRPASTEAPDYVRALYETPLLSFEQEQDLFRRYNFCKYHAVTLIRRLDPCKAGVRELREIENLLVLADGYQKRLIQSNLRLVVSIAQRHLSRGAPLFELVSDGNMALMRAVERFDVSRGFRFSTYASWAIMKNYARSIPEERRRYTRYVTGQEEVLSSAPQTGAVPVSSRAEVEGLKAALSEGLKHLDDREREIVVSHFGLEGQVQPSTLDQLGQKFGVTKERIRQIERRALCKLKGVLSPAWADLIHAA